MRSQLATAFVHYTSLLVEMHIPKDQIWQRITEIRKEAGFDEEGFDNVLELLIKRSGESVLRSER